MLMDIATVTEEQIAATFDNNGFELTVGYSSPSLSVEEAIVAVLIHPEPRLLEGIPILLKKNPVNYAFLRDMLDQYKVWNRFGYFGEFALTHIDNSDLREIVDHCSQQPKERANISSMEGTFFKDFRHDQERRWNLSGTPSYAALEKQWKRYCNDREVF